MASAAQKIPPTSSLIYLGYEISVFIKECKSLEICGSIIQKFRSLCDKGGVKVLNM